MLSDEAAPSQNTEAAPATKDSDKTYDPKQNKRFSTPDHALESFQDLVSGQNFGLDPSDLVKGSSPEIKARDDAIDFEDIDELADDEELEETGDQKSGEKINEAQEEHEESEDAAEDDRWLHELGLGDYFRQTAGVAFGAPFDSSTIATTISDKKSGDRSLDVQLDLDLANTDSQLLQTIDHALEKGLSEEKKNRETFPIPFKQGDRIRFLRLFPTKEAYVSVPKKKAPRALVPTRVTLEFAPDEKVIYNTRGKVPVSVEKNVRKITAADIEEMRLDGTREEDTLIKKRKQPDTFLGNTVLPDLLLCANWASKDLQILEDSDLAEKWHRSAGFEHLSSRDWLLAQQKVDDFSSSIHLLDGESSLRKPVLDLNDERLLVDVLSQDVDQKSLKTRDSAMQALFRSQASLSNDKEYEILRSQRHSNVRQSLSHLQIEHAGFAVRLQSPFYKTILSKTDCRNFHRPAFHAKADHTIRFSRLIKANKVHSSNLKSPSELLWKSSSISLADTHPYVLLEYSEELPPILNNCGMGSRLINYYRKNESDDITRPKLPFGETRLLEPQDLGPFWNFGFVDPGETVPTLYNNLVRAPVFRHEPQNTDFLLIQSSFAGSTRYYLRGIKHLYTVGQILPVIDIPSPHSRRVTATSKNRLKMVVFRLLHKHGNIGLSIKEILRHFADQNEMQIRQRLKEFMEYQKKGTEEYGLWKLKTTERLLDEQGTRELVSPEMVCLLDSMQAGSRQLEDEGYGKMEIEEESGDEENISAAHKMAPWTLTSNFVSAVQGKAMLALRGEGDPTGCGEGFSFVKTSMRGSFRSSIDRELDLDSTSERSSHMSSSASQQLIYEREIKKIWDAQKKSLMSTRDITEEEANEVAQHRQQERGSSVTPMPASLYGDEDDMMTDDGYSALPANKVLRIERRMKLPSGQFETRTEIVYNPHVINAYLRQRQQINDELTLAEQLEPSNDEEKNKRARKLIEEKLAVLKKNWERRQMRKALKAAGNVGRPSSPSRPQTPNDEEAGRLGTSSRKCSSCGQIGHMKSSRICPLFHENSDTFFKSKMHRMVAEE